jgi:hypothetical protein
MTSGGSGSVHGSTAGPVIQLRTCRGPYLFVIGSHVGRSPAHEGLLHGTTPPLRAYPSSARERKSLDVQYYQRNGQPTADGALGHAPLPVHVLAIVSPVPGREGEMESSTPRGAIIRLPRSHDPSWF